MHSTDTMNAHMIYSYAVVQVSERKWRVIRTLSDKARGADFYFESGPLGYTDAMLKARDLNREQEIFWADVEKANENAE